MAKSFLGQSALPRGIRNNNPGNLIRTSIAWNGKIPHGQSSDSHFEQFVNIEFGIRAMMLDIISDHAKGLNTVSKLISEYAPAHENNTLSYIAMVSGSIGVSSTAVFALTKKSLLALAKAIAVMENGAIARTILTDSDYESAYRILGKKLPESSSSYSLIVIAALVLTPIFLFK